MLLIVPVTFFGLASIVCVASVKKDEHESGGHKTESHGSTQKGGAQKSVAHHANHSSVPEHTQPEKYPSRSTNHGRQVHETQPAKTSATLRTASSYNGNAGNPKRSVIWSNSRSAEWHQAVANRKHFWNGWANENQPRVQKFQATRAERYGQISNYCPNRI